MSKFAEVKASCSSRRERRETRLAEKLQGERRKKKENKKKKEKKRKKEEEEEEERRR
jgi:hypothetical protein